MKPLTLAAAITAIAVMLPLASQPHGILRADDPAPGIAQQPRAAVGITPDPLEGTLQTNPAATGRDAEQILASLLPPRSDSPADWHAGLEPLHRCGEPRALRPCVPPPPCHPAEPPAPYDLVGVPGAPSCGPIYGGPCQPRAGRGDGAPLPWLQRISDRLVALFYTSKP